MRLVSSLCTPRRCELMGLMSALLHEKGYACWVACLGRMAELSHSACRRITNRESARRMRLKRQEEWAAIKRQVGCHCISTARVFC